MTEKLKPCPFCGGEPRRVDLDDIDETDSNFGGSLIECTQCGACSPVHFEFKENLLDSWNTRATGWRPKAEWRFVGENGRFVFFYPRQRADWCGETLGPMYEHGCEPPQRAMEWTLFMEITPPSSEAPHD